jgi:hypothetical protein
MPLFAFRDTEVVRTCDPFPSPSHWQKIAIRRRRFISGDISIDFRFSIQPTPTLCERSAHLRSQLGVFLHFGPDTDYQRGHFPSHPSSYTLTDLPLNPRNAEPHCRPNPPPNNIPPYRTHYVQRGGDRHYQETMRGMRLNPKNESRRRIERNEMTQRTPNVNFKN